MSNFDNIVHGFACEILCYYRYKNRLAKDDSLEYDHNIILADM